LLFEKKKKKEKRNLINENIRNNKMTYSLMLKNIKSDSISVSKSPTRTNPKIEVDHNKDNFKKQEFIPNSGSYQSQSLNYAESDDSRNSLD